MKQSTEFVPHYMAMSPSPSALFERLSDDEKIALDLLHQACGESLAGEPLEQFTLLVPVEGRRGYLRTLALRRRDATRAACADRSRRT